MGRLNERVAAGAAALAAAGAVLNAVAGRAWGLVSLQVLAPWLWISAAVSALAAARYALERREFEERQELELARVERPESSLFSPESGEAGAWRPAARARAQFEAVVVRAAAPVLALVEAIWAWRWGQRLRAGLFASPEGALAAAALLAAQAFVLFLAGRYLLGLAREPDRRWLRGPGALLATGALGSLAGIGAALAAHLDWPAADRAVAWAFTGALGALAADHLVGFLAEVYRPRRPGDFTGTAYESRLARWMAQPSDWVRDAARSLDYQFGFNVSETWWYRFLSSALVPLLAFQALVLYALTCVVVLGPDEEAILERFGRPRDGGGERWHLGPGLHWKWPWPFETVRRFPARRIQRLYVGFQHNEAEPWPATMLWTRPHFREEDQFLLPSREAGGEGAASGGAVPVSLLSINIPIEYRIRDLRRYAYGFADPARTLRALAYRTLSRVLAERDPAHVFGEGRLEVARAVQAALAREAEACGLGVEILYVGVYGVHPPVAIADAYETVVGALEEREAKVLEARAYRGRTLPLAEADARRRILEAQAYRERRTRVAEAEAVQFRSRRDAAARAPEVVRHWYLLQTIREALRSTRLYVVAAAPTSEVIQLNLEEKLPATLFDIGELGGDGNR